MPLFGACAAVRSHIYDDGRCSHTNLPALESFNTIHLQLMQLKPAKPNICLTSDMEFLISDAKPRALKQRAAVIAPTRSRRKELQIGACQERSSTFFFWYRRIYEWQKHTRSYEFDHADSGDSATHLFLSSDQLNVDHARRALGVSSY